MKTKFDTPTCLLEKLPEKRVSACAAAALFLTTAVNMARACANDILNVDKDVTGMSNNID